MGTGGSLTGNGRRLHAHDPAIQVIAAEPELGDMVYGLRSLDAGFIPPDLRSGTGRPEVPRGLRELAAHEPRAHRAGGYLLPASRSGAVVYVAQRIAQEIEEGDVVCLLADGGWKYLSTEAWASDLDVAEKGVAGVAVVVARGR